MREGTCLRSAAKLAPAGPRAPSSSSICDSSVFWGAIDVAEHEPHPRRQHRRLLRDGRPLPQKRTSKPVTTVHR